VCECVYSLYRGFFPSFFCRETTIRERRLALFFLISVKFTQGNQYSFISYLISVALPRHTCSPFVCIYRKRRSMQAREKCVNEKFTLNYATTTSWDKQKCSIQHLLNKSLSKYSNYVITFHPIQSLFLPINMF